MAETWSTSKQRELEFNLRNAMYCNLDGKDNCNKLFWILN